jgi:hypothetical protein
MRMRSRLVLEASVLALLLAAAGCTKPSTGNGATGGSSGSSTGGQTGATGGSTGTGGSKTTGTGGSATTGTGGSTVIGTGGSTTTGTGGSPTGATGGATGTGGSTTTGTGGAGGAIVQKDCATKTKIMSPLFMDFENYNGTVTATNYATAFGGTTVNTGTAYAGIYPYPESAGSTTPTLAILAGHPPSNWAGAETLQATQWGMGGGVWMGCADASAYKGISFWVRGSSGTGMFSFSVSMESTQLPDATNPAGGGTCPGTTDTCKDPIKSNIPITSDWTQVQILWSDFTAGISGTTSVVPNGDNIAGMAWTVPLQFHLDPSVSADAAGPYIPIPGAMTINIDDISFIQ